jgi:hypothetical protein
MRFLKEYRIFESLDKKVVKETCEDILLELGDDGFDCDVSVDEIVDANNKPLTNSIAVSVGHGLHETERRKVFNYDQISSTIDRVINYMKEEGYELEYPVRAMKAFLFPSTPEKLKGKEITGVAFIFDRR